jgi:ABC-type multidrug transport system fused ATPase/permease subunit
MQNHERRRSHGTEERLKIRQNVKIAAERGDEVAKKILFPVDFVSIKCIDVSFSYGTGKDTVTVIRNTSIEIPQGIALCVCGPRGHGKSTFLQLLSNVLLPDSGEVFVPPHLRVLHVSNEAFFIEDDVRENLFFGHGSQEVSNAQWQRALRICERLAFSHRLMDYVQSDQSTVDWMLNNAAVLSQSDRALLHFTRAFIYNPEVLVIHSPTLQLDGQLQKPLLESLRAFVDERGLEMPPESRHKRRPRTVIFSTNSLHGLNYADQFMLCQDQTLRYVTREYVSDLFSTWRGYHLEGSRTLGEEDSNVTQTQGRISLHEKSLAGIFV